MEEPKAPTLFVQRNLFALVVLCLLAGIVAHNFLLNEKRWAALVW